MNLKSIVILILFSCSCLHSQGYFLSGIIQDSVSNENLPCVSVIVESAITNQLIAVAATSEAGKFIINNIPADSVKIRFSIIGYDVKELDIKFKSDLDLGIILLRAAPVELSEIVVKSTKPMLEYYVDKVVINIDKVPGNTSSVTDALRNSGVVTVNPATNKVSLRGNSNVKVQLDGKPVTMPENFLNQLPASSVDKVEVITSSSAKQDPEGDAGIINIITKKGGTGKYSGNASLTASTQKSHLGNLMLNCRSGKFNFFTSASGGLGKIEFANSFNRKNYNSINFYEIQTSADSKADGHLLDAKIGFDFDYDSLNFFTVSGEFFKLKYDQNDFSLNNVFDRSPALQYGFSTNNETGNLHENETLSGFYRKILNANGTEITADIFYSRLSSRINSDLITRYTYLPGYPFPMETFIGIHNNSSIVKADYINPLPLGTIETGIHYTFRERKNDYYVRNYNFSSGARTDSFGLSNQFNYREDILAFYLQFKKNIDNFEFNTGLRLENTLTKGIQLTTGEIYKTDYISLFPSVLLAYKLSEQDQVSLGFSRRINRPQLEFINPFIKYDGPNNFSKGNPYLEPVFTNSVELKYFRLINLFYSHTKGNIQLVETTSNDSIKIQSVANTSLTRTYGFELSLPYYNDPQYPFKLPDFVTYLEAKFSYYRIEQEGNYFNESFNYPKKFWFFLFNGTVKLWYDIDATASWYYIPQLSDRRNSTGSSSYFTCILSRSFMEKQLKVSLIFNNILNTNTYRIITYGSDFYSNVSYRNLYASGLFLSLSFSFNDFKARQERNVEDGRDRVESGIFKNN